jgi:hypothetical protein
MKKIFAFIVGFIVLSCNPKIVNGIEKSKIISTPMKGKYSMAQFDSMCVADSLPRNLGYWDFLGLKDYESHERTSLFFYIKNLGTDDVIYKVEETMDDSVKITKRLMYE